MTEVSGIVGNTQQEAAEATVAREATKVAWQEQIFTHVVIGFVLLIISYLLLTSLEWNFFWKLLTGGALIYGGGKLASATAKLKWYWPNIIRGVGIGIILLTLLQSGFVKLVGTGINKLEEVAAGVNTPVQPLDPEEQARRVAVAKQDAEVIAAQRAATATAERQAELDTARAQEASMMDAKAIPCVRKYTGYGNCVTVTFGVNTKYDRELIKGHCLVSDPVSALTRTNLGGYQYRYTGQSGLVAQFFDLPVGQTVGTFTCGS